MLWALHGSARANPLDSSAQLYALDFVTAQPTHAQMLVARICYDHLRPAGIVRKISINSSTVIHA
ncbi:MAG: hypothetical protein MZW92_36265 [Comamonadaceae bacterium]|nr:hypothetical protein [Comamonadaceae bacterium]